MNSAHVHERPAEVTATEFRQDIARILRDAEYGRPTVITRDRQPVAKVVHPDADQTPHPAVWGAARADFNAAMVDPQGEYRRAILALGKLLRAHYHPGQESDVKTCVHCGAAIAVTAAGSHWVDSEGWDHCDGTSTSHEPAQEAL